MAMIARLQRQIRQSGPLSIAQYMTLCLLDPVDGYYPTRDPIGAGADFITSPEISQIYGELIGICIAGIWENMARPEQINLVEFGPGKGTMMSDILRTSRALPAYSKALNIHLIETSAALVAVQAKTLGSFSQPIHWRDHLDDVEPGPLVIVANEYLDCLPVRQFIYQNGHWFERMVDCTKEGTLQYVLDQTPIPPIDIGQIPERLRDAEPGTLIEIRPGIQALLETLADRAKKMPVIALFMDYGPLNSEFGDTVQAVSAHQKVDPLQRPGKVDMTARVDFGQLSELAKNNGFAVAGPIPQNEWLLRMGLMERAAALLNGGLADKSVLARQLHRLTDTTEMGDLFKFMAITSTDLPAPSGF